VKKMPFVPPPPPLDYAYKDGFDTPCLPILWQFWTTLLVSAL
jgi:hypothetical protein